MLVEIEISLPHMYLILPMKVTPLKLRILPQFFM